VRSCCIGGEVRARPHRAATHGAVRICWTQPGAPAMHYMHQMSNVHAVVSNGRRRPFMMPPCGATAEPHNMRRQTAQIQIHLVLEIQNIFQ
jgi:hypothetical protein